MLAPDPSADTTSREAALSSPTISRLQRADATGDPAPTVPGGRVLRARRGLPGNRAVVGGLLMVVAAVTAWWGATGAGRAPAPRYVVADRAIPPGQVITADDLREQAVDLPATLRARAFTDRRELVGTVALGPVQAGELLQAGAVTSAGSDAPVRELSFSIEADWAVDGTLRPGDRIDLYATYGDGTSSQTERVLHAATVRRLGTSGGTGLGERRTQTITLALAEGVGAGPVVNATRAATVTVVRVTGSAPEAGGRTDRTGSPVEADAGTGGDTYRAADDLGTFGATPDAGATDSPGGHGGGR